MLSSQFATDRPLTGRARPIAIVAWLAGVGMVLAQIIYAVTDPAARLAVTAVSVVAFATASVGDAAARFGVRAAGGLVVVAGGGGLAAETIGVHTGFPFGTYTYTDTLGSTVLGVPLLVPAAWIMMAWPSVLVGRVVVTATRQAQKRRSSAPVFWQAVIVGGWALASWDVFLDPQMVDAGHWVWADPTPSLPGVAGVPVTNFLGWLLVASLIVAGLNSLVGTARDGDELGLRAGPAPILYLWTYGSSVWAHAAFFNRPWVSLVGGALMGITAVPFALALWRNQAHEQWHTIRSRLWRARR